MAVGLLLDIRVLAKLGGDGESEAGFVMGRSRKPERIALRQCNVVVSECIVRTL
jgi:hypothetical protein